MSEGYLNGNLAQPWLRPSVRPQQPRELTLTQRNGKFEVIVDFDVPSINTSAESFNPRDTVETCLVHHRDRVADEIRSGWEVWKAKHLAVVAMAKQVARIDVLLAGAFGGGILPELVCCNESPRAVHVERIFFRKTRETQLYLAGLEREVLGFRQEFLDAFPAALSEIPREVREMTVQDLSDEYGGSFREALKEATRERRSQYRDSRRVLRRIFGSGSGCW